MKQAFTDTMQDWLFLLLLGLGIKMLPTEFFGGLFLAMAASMVARQWLQEQDKREVWVVLLSAAVLATFAAMVLSYLRTPAAPDWAELPPEFPIQSVMAFTGFGSRFIIRFSLRLMGRVEARGDQVADRVIDRVLPPAVGGGEPGERG